MDQFAQLKKHFARIGAPVRMDVYPDVHGWRSRLPTRFALDVRTDHKSREEFFLISMVEDEVKFHMAGTDLSLKHLLLQAHTKEAQHVRGGGETHTFKFLCGHDERHWFVAGIAPHVNSLTAALESLKPPEVSAAQMRLHLSRTQRMRRKNRAYVRQGEWFFLPEPSLVANDAIIMKNERIRRGLGSPHLVQELYRCGGTTVYVCRQYPQAISAETYRDLLLQDPSRKRWDWKVMKRDMTAYARGTVTHRDHRTIRLPYWHRILMNTEYAARLVGGESPVVFLD